MEDFIKKNRIFWSHFNTKNSGKKILVEEPGRVMIFHANAVFTIILNQARGYLPVWLGGRKPVQERQLVESYLPEARLISATIKWWPLKLYAALIALPKFLNAKRHHDLLGFCYDGVKYGDIVYDVYLFENKVATVRKIDWRIYLIMAKCIFRHLKIKSILRSDNYVGVLVSHLIGISSGVMLRTALRYNYEVYLRTGHERQTFQKLKGIDKIYNYPLRVHSSEVDELLYNMGPELDKTFEKVFRREVSGQGNSNSVRAFSEANQYYTDRTQFNENYGLKSQKKNVFVMLHVFNDHPHSHFRWMLFRDYYDWLAKTLEFAKRNRKVNWIFKQHPSSHLYKVKDVSLKKLFSDVPDNIILLEGDKQVNTQSLIYCADMVITCIGSAGFELPALAGIPSITAGDNPYQGLGFALEPKTQADYFNLLSKADQIEKLSPKNQKRARATFIKIYDSIYFSVSACPRLSEAEEKDKNITDKYFSRVMGQYSQKKESIFLEVEKLSNKITHPNFRRLENINRNLADE